MSDDTPERLTLSRWSRRKLDAARAKAQPPAAPPAVEAAPVAATPAPAAEALPPVESLTIDSDFAAFLSPKVDEAVKRAALRKLFSDPRFNVMDGLDVYIDDYTKADPLPEGMLAKLEEAYKALAESASDPVPRDELAPALAADPPAANDSAPPEAGSTDVIDER
jgi:hypothetical protein